MKVNRAKSTARPIAGEPTAVSVRLAGCMAPAPAITNTSSGSSFTTVAAVTNWPPRRTPRKLIVATMPSRPMMLMTRSVGAHTGDARAETTAANAAVTPPQASTSPTRSSMPQMNPGKGP
jgi:hypothetical protein